MYGGRGQWGYEGGKYLGVPTTIPANILPGKYLIRHEPLFYWKELYFPNNNWFEPAGYQFYPNCAQLHVIGTGTKLPPKEDLVSFPGAYSLNDPGVYYRSSYPYGFEFVGPKVWTGN